jgi:hypothetical protein
MEAIQSGFIELFTNTVTSKTVYLNVLFPSKYRYYFEFVGDANTSVLLDHPFRLYFPQTTTVAWVAPPGSNGIYLVIGANPEFVPFGSLEMQIYIPQTTYDAIIHAMNNPISSLSDLSPMPSTNTIGNVEFVLVSIDAGDQIKFDLINTSYITEVPITVKTLQWNQPLYSIMNSTDFEFAYTSDGSLVITFVDPRYCFLRECVVFPDDWTQAIKSFAGIT